MIDTLDRKIHQMHAALGALSTTDLTNLSAEIVHTPTYRSIKMDFNSGSDPIFLANVASLLIANIASLKDHLKHWCATKGIEFRGDRLIGSNKSVALIHDLWNVDKHFDLTSKPRSGHKPKLQNMRSVLALSGGAEAGSGSFFSMDPRTGKVTTGSAGSGSVSITLEAQIVDENGVLHGHFPSVCEEAASAWEGELRAAGVPVP